MNSDVRTLFDDELLPLCGSLIDTYKTKETIINNNDVDDILEDIKDTINDIFDQYNCKNIKLTENLDKPLFGIIVNPVLNNKAAMKVLFDEEIPTVKDYFVEIDLGLLNDIDRLELGAYLIEEIEGMMNPNTIKTVGEVIDILAANQDTAINLSCSMNYITLMNFAIVESMRDIGSFLLKDSNNVARSDYAQTLEYKNALVSLGLRLKSSINNKGSVVVSPKLSILQWVFEIYKDIKTNYKYARGVLEDAARVTGSYLLKCNTDFAIAALDKELTSALSESATGIAEYNKAVKYRREEAFNEIGLFKSLKKSGLKGLENELYEYKLRVKECKDPDEGAWIMRQLSARITIIEDYLDTEDNIKDYERERWEEVSRLYRDLRMELASKKLNKAQYGIFVDYDYFDDKYGK